MPATRRAIENETVTARRPRAAHDPAAVFRARRALGKDLLRFRSVLTSAQQLHVLDVDVDLRERTGVGNVCVCRGPGVEAGYMRASS